MQSKYPAEETGGEEVVNYLQMGHLIVKEGKNHVNSFNDIYKPRKLKDKLQRQQQSTPLLQATLHKEEEAEANE